MEFQFNNKTYDLNIEPLTVIDGHLIYSCGEPKFSISNLFSNDDITQIILIREQVLKGLDIYIGEKCGIYNLKITSREIVNLDNKYIEEAIKNGGEYNIEDILFKVIKEEFSDIEYVSGDQFNDNDIKLYMSTKTTYEGIVLYIN